MKRITIIAISVLMAAGAMAQNRDNKINENFGKGNTPFLGTPEGKFDSIPGYSVDKSTPTQTPQSSTTTIPSPQPSQPAPAPKKGSN
jgi:hypothetical protein